MARCVLLYLNTTINIPLVLGGSTTTQITSYTDASLGTAPKGRTAVADINKLHPDAGAVSANTKATQVVFSSSFEAQLDGVTRGLKSQCHRWDKRRTIAVTAIAVHRTIARSIVTRVRYRWLYFRYTR